MVKRTRYCDKSFHTDGFAQLASTTNRTALPFDNGIELTASTACIITPPPLIRNIGEGKSGPQTVSAETLYLQIRPSRYSITDLYIYTSCSAVAVIVVLTLTMFLNRFFCELNFTWVILQSDAIFVLTATNQ